MLVSNKSLISYDMEMTEKSHFRHEKVQILSLCTQCGYGHHYITLLNI